jgi:FKBP-type peptidyl-prolyl cis-trans isomerase
MYWRIITMNYMQIFKYIGYSLIAIFLISCVSNNSKNGSNGNHLNRTPGLEEQLIEANKRVVQTESQQIDFFLSRYKWDIIKTKTGLRYWIYESKDTGKQPIDGDIVKLSYTLKDIKGDIIYSSDKDGFLSFELGKSNEPAGLQEGIRLMKLNEKAKLIIPSHLGHGLTGDSKSIGSKMTLIYDIELIGIYNKKR